jgi:hypothetical protein
MTKYKGVDVSDIDLDSLTPEELAELQKQIDEDNKNLMKPQQKDVKIDLPNLKGADAVAALTNIDSYLGNLASQKANSDEDVPEGLKQAQAREMQGYKPNSSFVPNSDEDVPDGLTVDALKKYKMPVAKPSEVPVETPTTATTDVKADDEDLTTGNPDMYSAKRNTYDLENLLNKQADLNLLKHRRYNAPIWNPTDTDVITKKLEDSIQLTPDGNEPFQSEANRLAQKRISDVTMLSTLRNTYNTMAQKAAMDKLNAQTYDKNVDISNQRVGVADKQLSVASSDLKGVLNGQDAVIYDENGYARPNPDYVPSQHRKALNLPKANWNGTDPDVNASVTAALKEKIDAYNARRSDKLSAEMDAETTRNMAYQAEQQASASELGTENVRKQHNDFARETPFKSIPKGKVVFNDATGEVVPVNQPLTEGKVVFNDSTGEVEPVNQPSTDVAPTVADNVPDGLKTTTATGNTKQKSKQGNKTGGTTTTTTTTQEQQKEVARASSILSQQNRRQNNITMAGSPLKPNDAGDMQILRNGILKGAKDGTLTWDYSFAVAGVTEDEFNQAKKEGGQGTIDNLTLGGYLTNSGITAGEATRASNLSSLKKLFSMKRPNDKFDDYYAITQNKNGTYTVRLKK